MRRHFPRWLQAGLALAALVALLGGVLALRARYGGSGGSPLAPSYLGLDVAQLEAVVSPGAPSPPLVAGQRIVEDGPERLVVSDRATFGLQRVQRSVDPQGRPALLVEVRPAERAALEAWTRARVGERVWLRVSGVTCRPVVAAPSAGGQLLLQDSGVEPARFQAELLSLLRAVGL